MKDDLGDRMKDYEDRSRFLLPRRTYTIIRVDGKAFHTFTKGFKRPFDHRLMEVMDQTAIAMCEEIQGAAFAFVQSDEISILLTDFDKPKTNSWFDSNLQKMASVSASIATAAFNNGMYLHEEIMLSMEKKAYFDSRAFTIPDIKEVENYFIWRQNDASRNSVQMVAQSLYSHKELQGKDTNQLQEMIYQMGFNWNDFTPGEKRGRIIEKIQVRELIGIPRGPNKGQQIEVERGRWVVTQPPIFTQEKSFLRSRIPWPVGFEWPVERYTEKEIDEALQANIELKAKDGENI